MVLRWKCSMVAALVLCAGAPLVSAQSLPESLQACAADSDNTRRLACYDKLAHGLPKTASARPAATLSPEEKFGIQGDQQRKAEKEKGVERPPELTQLQAHITQLTTKPRGELVFSLDNGQVWEQIEEKSGLLVKNGQAVTITTGALGSFWLTPESGRAIRVKRTR